MHEDQQLHINLPSTQLTLLPRYGTYVMTVHRNQDLSQYKEQYAEQWYPSAPYPLGYAESSQRQCCPSLMMLKETEDAFDCPTAERASLEWPVHSIIKC